VFGCKVEEIKNKLPETMQNSGSQNLTGERMALASPGILLQPNLGGAAWESEC
jgi:hypothetical protein